MAKRILIIEDEVPLAEEWALGLAELGYETRIVAKLSEFLAVLDRLEFDLILLDVMLPTIDLSKDVNSANLGYGRTAGVWVAQRIKQKKPSLPIIVVTVVSDNVILQRLREAGVARILTKPRITVREIQEAVKLLCG